MSNSQEKQSLSTVQRIVQDHHGLLQTIIEDILKIKNFLCGHPQLGEEAKKEFLDLVEEIKSPTNVVNAITLAKDTVTIAEDLVKKQ